MEIVLSLSTLSPLTHLCPCEDRAHSGVPRPCRRCSSTSPGSGLWAVHARSPATQRLSGSTGPAQPEPPNLKAGGWGGTGSRQGGWLLSVQEDPTVGQKRGRYSPTHLFLSSTHPALQEHLKLPSVFKQSPFWHTPCMEHSLMSERKVGGGVGVYVKKLFQAAIFHILTLDLSLRQTCNTLTMRAVEPFIALRTSRAGVFHNRLLDWCIWENRQADKTAFLQSLREKNLVFFYWWQNTASCWYGQFLSCKS